MRGAAAPRVAFLRKKLRKNLLQRDTAIPAKFTHILFDRLPPIPLLRAIRVIFEGILFACEKNSLGPREIRAKESELSFARISLGLKEKLMLLLQK